MKIVDNFDSYKVLSMNDGEKLEKWGNIILRRPDPQVIWKEEKHPLWNKANAVYTRSNTGGGSWKLNNKFNNVWQIKYQDLVFNIKLMNFKHTGLFPEQAYNWNYIKEKLKGTKDKKVLNLFAYTGAASLAALSAGASVVHVDSSKGMVEWAKENVKSSGFSDRAIRYIVDDVIKFVKREIRRGNKYDAIIMDPPSFGKGSSGEIWKFEKSLFELLELCKELISDDALFVIVNTYSTGYSSTVVENCLKMTIDKKQKGTITSDELGVKSENGLILPCGAYTRWEK